MSGAGLDLDEMDELLRYMRYADEYVRYADEKCRARNVELRALLMECDDQFGLLPELNLEQMLSKIFSLREKIRLALKSDIRTAGRADCIDT